MTLNDSIISRRPIPIFCIFGFTGMLINTHGILQYINVVGLALSVVTCTLKLRSAIFSKRWAIGFPILLLNIVCIEWTFLYNFKTEWFASWKWSVAIFAFAVLMLFIGIGSFKEICVKNGRLAAYLAFAWVTLWTSLHFIKMPTDCFGHILAVCWYVFTALTAIAVAVGYVRHMAGTFLLSAWFLCMMDIVFYQLLPYFMYGTPIFRSISWAGQFWT